MSNGITHHEAAAVATTIDTDIVATVTTAITPQANEWESTIRISSTRDVYERAEGLIDNIFLFNNGTRMSARRLERKRILTSKYVLGFLDGRMVPLRRTSAHETLASVASDLQIKRVTRRKIQHLQHGIRLTFNREECELGERYSIEYEIEYDGERLSYDDILAREKLLMQAAIERGHLIRCKNMTLEHIFGCVMTKVQMWHCLDPDKPYRWAYKWNGMKAKLMIPSAVRSDDGESGDIAYVWPDADVIRTERFHGDRALFENLSLLVEIMDEVMLVIEVIGTQFEDDNNIYTTEPSTNLKMLDYLRQRTIAGGCVNRVGDRVLLIQTFFDGPMPDHETDAEEEETSDATVSRTKQYDGYIIAQGDIMIKWKIPTIDVRCIAPHTFQVANRTYTLAEEGIENAIYEMAPDQRLLRRRTDRLAASTDGEYELFERSVKLMERNRVVPTLSPTIELSTD